MAKRKSSTKFKYKLHTYRGIKYQLVPGAGGYKELEATVYIRDSYGGWETKQLKLVDSTNLEKYIIIAHAEVRNMLDVFLRLKELQGKDFESFIELYRKTEHTNV